jgi:hypothetical protein
MGLAVKLNGMDVSNVELVARRQRAGRSVRLRSQRRCRLARGNTSTGRIDGARRDLSTHGHNVRQDRGSTRETVGVFSPIVQLWKVVVLLQVPRGLVGETLLLTADLGCETLPLTVDLEGSTPRLILPQRNRTGCLPIVGRDPSDPRALDGSTGRLGRWQRRLIVRQLVQQLLMFTHERHVRLEHRVRVEHDRWLMLRSSKADVNIARVDTIHTRAVEP